MAAIYYKLCARHCDRQLTYIDSLYSQHSPVKFVIPILQVRKLSFSLPKVTSKEQQGQTDHRCQTAKEIPEKYVVIFLRAYS